MVNRRFINDLPLIDRQVINLVSLAPGVTEMDDQCGVGCTGTNFVSNGSRGSTSDILTDGASVTNSEPNGGITMATYLPSPEAVEEFKVEQTNFSAEYGFSGGSVINMVTRSGTNKFHGSVYDFVRDQSLDANQWFNDYYAAITGVPQPKGALRRNNYGGTIGGPIIKNKTFFFFDYDASRQTGQSSAAAGVPTDAMRSGDFGQLCSEWQGTFDTNGLCSVPQGQIWDPYLRYNDPNAGGAVANSANSYIPFNNVGTYISPGCDAAFLFAQTGRPCPPAANQPAPGVAGNLMDPVALKMFSLFPRAEHSKRIHLQKLVRHGSQPELQSPVRYQDRSSLQPERSTQRKIFVPVQHGPRSSIALRISPILASPDRGGAMRTCLPSTRRTRSIRPC